MVLFPERLDMTLELDKLEKLMPSYAEPLRVVSKFIRSKLWPFSEETILAALLNSLNSVFYIVVDILGEQFDFIEWYIIFLQKYGSQYALMDMTEEFTDIIIRIKQYKTQELMRRHWKQINPYFIDEFPEDDLFEKSIINLMDDAFSTVMEANQHAFFVNLKDIKNITRGRRDIWSKVEDLLPPSIAIAQTNVIVNRWNPPDKRYLYLSLADDSSCADNEFVCFEEMRCSVGEVVTFADFSVDSKAKSKKVINLDYDGISRQDLINKFSFFERDTVQDIVEQSISFGEKPNKKDIKAAIDQRHKKITKEISIYCGQLFLKELCDAIFTPLDDDEDSNPAIKDKCYKSFHILSEYLENKDVSGIIYPSTRTKLKGIHGQNVVLFNVDDAYPILSSFRMKSKI